MKKQNNQTLDSGSDMDDLHKILHDLRGPIINIDGLNQEMQDSLTELHKVLQNYSDQLPEAFLQQMLELMHDDLLPCSILMDKATTQLHSRADSIEAVTQL